MAKPTPLQNASSFFSEELTSEFQSVLRDQFGKNVTLSEAQQIGLHIAQFVLMKEVRRKTTA